MLQAVILTIVSLRMDVYNGIAISEIFGKICPLYLLIIDTVGYTVCA